MKFFLGTHEVSWLSRVTDELFISRRRLARIKKKYPHALGPWAMDSGGFTELNQFGRWTITPAEYVAEVRKYRDAIGNMLWAAPQDWMCEPEVIAKTGLSVGEHQQRTVDNFLELKSLAPDLPIIPVLQGWWGQDKRGNRLPGGTYEDCIEKYAKAGVDLKQYPLVGIGSICRKQQTGIGFFMKLESQLRELSDAGVRFHAFGLKAEGLETLAGGAIDPIFASADSLAWSFGARHDSIAPCTEAHTTCNNCIVYALQWRQLMVERVNRINNLRTA